MMNKWWIKGDEESMKKRNVIVLALSTLLVVCNALPMNNHVESKKEAVISQKEV